MDEACFACKCSNGDIVYVFGSKSKPVMKRLLEKLLGMKEGVVPFGLHYLFQSGQLEQNFGGSES